jgi:hypothetical protein
MGPDPESSFYLKPEYCTDNRYTLSKDHFNLRYGTGEILSEEDRYENKNIPGEKVNPQKGKNNLSQAFFLRNQLFILSMLQNRKHQYCWINPTVLQRRR